MKLIAIFQFTTLFVIGDVVCGSLVLKPQKIEPVVILKDLSGGHNVVGKKIELECQTTFYAKYVSIEWKTPKNVYKNVNLRESTNSSYAAISTLVVHEAETQHSGLYICEIIHKELNYTLVTRKMSIRVYGEKDHVIKIKHEYVEFNGKDIEFQIQSHPDISVEWYKINNYRQEIMKNSSNITISLTPTINDEEYNYKAKLIFKYISSYDDFYKIIVDNGIEKSEALFLFYFQQTNVKLSLININEDKMTAVYQCSARGGTKPNVTWIFEPCETLECLDFTTIERFFKKSILLEELYNEDQGFQVVSYVAVNLTEIGLLKCVTQNSEAVETVFYAKNNLQYFVIDKANLSDIHNKRLDAEYLQTVKILCLRSASKYTGHIFWYHNGKMINFNKWSFFLAENKTFLATTLDHLEFKIVSEDQLGNFTCQILTRTGEAVSQTVEVVPKNMSSLVPKISFRDVNGGYTTVGEDIRLVCNVTYYKHVLIDWWFTGRKNNKTIQTNSIVDNKTAFENHVETIVDINVYLTTSYLTISQANVTESGHYGCSPFSSVSPHHYFSRVDMLVQVYVNETSLSFEKETKFDLENLNLKVLMTAHPSPTIKWFDNHGKEIVFEQTGVSHFLLSFNQIFDRTKNAANYEATLTFNSFDIENFGNYTVIAENEAGKISYSVQVNATGKPTAKIDVYKMSTENATLKCSSTAYPKPTIQWYFKNCTTLKNCLEFKLTNSVYKFENKYLRLNELWNEKNGLQFTSYISVNISKRGILVCRSVNSFGQKYTYEPILGSGNGFEMFVENADHTKYSNKPFEIVGDKEFNVICAVSKLKYLNEFKLLNIIDKYSRLDIFDGSQQDFIFASFLITTITVISPSINSFNCAALKNGFPKSLTFHVESHLSAYVNISRTNMADNSVQVDLTSKWKFYCYPEGFPTPDLKWYKNDKVILHSDKFKFTNNEQVMEIDNVLPEDEGIYKCEAFNDYRTITVYSSLNVVITNTWFYVQIILLLCALGFIAILAFIKFRKARKIHKKLKSLGLIYSQGTSLSTLNPELSIQDQAFLLPFSQKWEIPFRSIILGKQLGSGAFGVTFQATIVNYFPDDPMKTVAVKTVNPSSGFDCIKALVSELKILSHLGSHVNIVNFLGACTQHLLKDELYLVLEFCSFGSLLDHIKRYSQNFIYQKDYDSDEFNWSSGIEDVEETKNTNAISSKDFLIWSFQIARGMDYLSSRNVVHGDLAARNVLLTDQNVVKVCDFGLAKNVYNYGKYVKKSQGLLPIKWMAIESIEKGVFSTQSDVWSFGVVLWEIFSLGLSPYFNETVDEHFCKKLTDGYRMKPPKTATSKIYNLMLTCWHLDPSIRPSFTNLSEQIGSILEDPIKNYYISMNSDYILMNKERFDKNSDYLAMIEAPTYQNLMSKSCLSQVDDNAEDVIDPE